MKKPEIIIKELKKLQPGVEWLPIDEVFENPDNPRTISEEDYDALKRSITKFPAMMVLRPGIIDAKAVLFSNNQRHRVCKELGWPEFPIIRADKLTPAQLKEFTIKDNFHAGSWDADKLFKDWDLTALEDWAFDMSLLDVRPPEEEFSQIGEQAPANNLKHMKTITLKYSEKDHKLVKEKLQAIADTPEHAVWKLLGLEKKKKITTK